MVVSSSIRIPKARPNLHEHLPRGLHQMEDVLTRYPEHAFRELVAFCKSFPAPVPGRLGERIGRHELT